MDFGKVRYQAIAILIASIVKLVLNLILIPIEWIGINGAAISTIVSQFIIAAILLWQTKKHLELTINLNKFFIKPTIASIIMGILTFITYKIAMGTLEVEPIATLLAIAVAVITYGLMCLALKIVTKEEIEMLPIGKKIIRLFT